MSKGKQITFPTIINAKGTNRRTFVTGKLEPQTYNGYNFLGFKPLSYSSIQPTKSFNDIEDNIILTDEMPVEDVVRDISSQLEQLFPGEPYTVKYNIYSRFNTDGSDDDFAGTIVFRHNGRRLPSGKELLFVVKDGVVKDFLGYFHILYNSDIDSIFKNDDKYGKEYQYWENQKEAEYERSKKINAERQEINRIQNQISKEKIQTAANKREQERIAKIPEQTRNIDGSTLKYKEIEREVTNRSRGGYRAKYLITYRDPDISDEDITDSFMSSEGLYHYGRVGVHDGYITVIDHGGD